MSKKLLIFIIALTIFSLLLRAYRFTQPPRYYFDEVYHAVTAKAYAGNNPAAYNPFSPAPKEGTAYDWLHPPLAKLIQALSIKIFGDNPFGWRLPSVIFGTLIIPATFALAYIVFSPTVAIFASLVIAFENLTYVMSRITMNDVFITFFALSAFIFTALFVKFKKKKYILLTSIFLGLSVGTKWTGLYASVAIVAYLIIRRGDVDIKKWLLPILVIPSFIYIASYGQFWVQKHTLSDFINLHKQIWWYQNRHDLEHSYGTTPLYCVSKGTNSDKTWCPWALNARGVYFSYEAYGDRAGFIYALGNPLIFWAGIIAISYLIGKFLEEKDKKILLIIFGYFIFWLPFIFTPRLLFLYHYLPSLPFLTIALGVSLAAIYETKFKYAAVIILLIFVAAFFYFYPITSGWPIKPDSIDRYMWLSTWR